MIHRFPRADGIDHRLVEVEPGLFQGSCLPGFDADIQRRFGIEMVLSVTTKSVPGVKETCRYWMCMEDGEPWSDTLIGFVRRFARDSRNNVALVHCDHGVSRSGGAIVVCLMERHRSSKDEAFRLLQAVDPAARVHEAIWNSIPTRFDP